MSFLLDTDICSTHLKRPAGLMHRFVQYSGRLHLSTIALGELYVWAFHRQDPAPIIRRIENDLLADVIVLDYDSECARTFGQTRAQLFPQGISVPTTDLMIASVALVHDLTLVTHNTSDYRNIPGLRVEDWLTP
jgi:tRNA(fMet)-specific endonuclease VapC